MAVSFWSGGDANATAATRTTCASYAPGHQMHYIHQGQALRSPSEHARHVTVDDDEVVIVRETGERLVWRHHDTTRLSDILGLFPSSRVVYPGFHALRVGPYWFNCADGAFEPCQPVEVDTP